ncbi:MAG: type III pantothenate kinase [Candidatus Omnitrophota bacterium]
MILAIDIGNTNITLGFFKNSRLVERVAFATAAGQYFSFLKKSFNKYPVDKIIISSVVPQAAKKLKQALRKLKFNNAFILGENLLVPIKNKYQSPQQAGQDRLVNAFAAIKLYGCPAIVADFGTAVTFDAVSKKGEFLGGMIFPGMEASLSCLAQKTALLPKINLIGQPKDMIGKNTRDGMISGMIYGFSSLSDGVIKELKRELGKNTIAIGTGGNINVISSHCHEFSVIDINLTLKGLKLILETIKLA